MIYPKGKAIVLTSDTGGQFKLTGISGSITLPKTYTVITQAAPVPVPPPAPTPSTPKLVLTPDTGAYGQTITVKGSGFNTNDNVTVYEQGAGDPARFLFARMICQEGTFSLTTKMPPESDPRIFAMYQITAVVAGQTDGPKAVYTVIG